MEKITAFKTNDGRFFETQKEAEDHERKLLIDKTIEGILSVGTSVQHVSTYDVVLTKYELTHHRKEITKQLCELNLDEAMDRLVKGMVYLERGDRCVIDKRSVYSAIEALTGIRIQLEG